MNDPITGLDMLRFAMAACDASSGARMLYGTAAGEGVVPHAVLAGFAFRDGESFYAVNVEWCVKLLRTIGVTGSVGDGLDAWKLALRVAGLAAPSIDHAANAAGLHL